MKLRNIWKSYYKYYHLQAKEYVEVFADKNVYKKSKEQTEVISENLLLSLQKNTQKSLLINKLY